MARGSVRGAKMQVDQVSYQPIGENSEGRSVTAEEALHSAVADLGAKGEVTVVLSREVVEVRTLSIPRIDADELPDVIRFQAQRQLTSMTDNWSLDYVMLPHVAGQEMQTALVGGVSPAHLAELDRACTSAGLQATRILLRPIEIARFVIQSGKLESAGATMIICIAEQSAELLILRDGHVVQIRGTRLSTEPEHVATSLKGEIRRSLMAASPQLGDTSLTGVLLISTSAVADQLDGVISEAAGAAVSHIDPVLILPSSIAERESLASKVPHRLAAIAGAIASETAEKQSLVDFRNPKKRPPKKKNTGRYLLYGGVAGLCLMAGLVWWISKNRQMDQEIAFYKSQIAEKKEILELAESKVKDFGQVQEFLDASPNWLDELVYISQKIPAAEKVLLGAPTKFSIEKDGKAKIEVPVKADNPDSISEFQKSLQSEHYVVKGFNSTKLLQAEGRYEWTVNEVIQIKGRGWDVFRSKPTSTSVSENSQTAPSTTDAPSDSAELTSNETTSAADETTPAADQATPAADQVATDASETADEETSPAELNTEDLNTEGASTGESNTEETITEETNTAETNIAAPVEPANESTDAVVEEVIETEASTQLETNNPTPPVSPTPPGS